MLKKTVACVFVCALISLARPLLAQNDVLAGKYQIIPEESRIEIKTGTAGLFGFAGHSHSIIPSNFSGEVEINASDPKGTQVTILIQAPSLKETGDFSSKEIEEIDSQMHNTVLESSKYPEIAFHSTAVKYKEGGGHVYDAQIEGDLALHGVTKRITVPARITVDGSTLRANGSFKIERPDFKIETKSAGGGTVKVAKTLEINFLFVLKH